MALTKAIALLEVLKQEMNKYHRDYDQLIDSFLGDKQRKKPIGEFLQDLRAITPKKEVESSVSHPEPGM
ncbi:hypothetical protein GAMM_10059 [Gammaproteobacteria bacterium]